MLQVPYRLVSSLVAVLSTPPSLFFSNLTQCSEATGLFLIQSPQGCGEVYGFLLIQYPLPSLSLFLTPLTITPSPPLLERSKVPFVPVL